MCNTIQFWSKQHLLRTSQIKLLIKLWNKQSECKMCKNGKLLQCYIVHYWIIAYQREQEADIPFCCQQNSNSSSEVKPIKKAEETLKPTGMGFWRAADRSRVEMITNDRIREIREIKRTDCGRRCQRYTINIYKNKVWLSLLNGI